MATGDEAAEVMAVQWRSNAHGDWLGVSDGANGRVSFVIMRNEYGNPILYYWDRDVWCGSVDGSKRYAETIAKCFHAAPRAEIEKLERDFAEGKQS